MGIFLERTAQLEGVSGWPFEVFYMYRRECDLLNVVEAEILEGEELFTPGWYTWARYPGRLPTQFPIGPHLTIAAAVAEAKNVALA